MLEIRPEELVLDGVADRERRTKFAIINTCGKSQAFKVKSTCPQRISPDPKWGYIKAFDRCEILVTVEAPNDNGSLIREKEKLLVQSAITSVPPGSWERVSAREVLRLTKNSDIFDFRLSLRFKPTTKRIEKQVEPLISTPEEYGDLNHQLDIYNNNHLDRRQNIHNDDFDRRQNIHNDAMLANLPGIAEFEPEGESHRTEENQDTQLAKVENSPVNIDVIDYDGGDDILRQEGSDVDVLSDRVSALENMLKSKPNCRQRDLEASPLTWLCIGAAIGALAVNGLRRG